MSSIVPECTFIDEFDAVIAKILPCLPNLAPKAKFKIVDAFCGNCSLLSVLLAIHQSQRTVETIYYGLDEDIVSLHYHALATVRDVLRGEPQEPAKLPKPFHATLLEGDIWLPDPRLVHPTVMFLKDQFSNLWEQEQLAHTTNSFSAESKCTVAHCLFQAWAPEILFLNAGQPPADWHGDAALWETHFAVWCDRAAEQYGYKVEHVTHRAWDSSKVQTLTVLSRMAADQSVHNITAPCTPYQLVYQATWPLPVSAMPAGSTKSPSSVKSANRASTKAINTSKSSVQLRKRRSDWRSVENLLKSKAATQGENTAHLSLLLRALVERDDPLFNLLALELDLQHDPLRSYVEGMRKIREHRVLLSRDTSDGDSAAMEVQQSLERHWLHTLDTKWTLKAREERDQCVAGMSGDLQLQDVDKENKETATEQNGCEKCPAECDVSLLSARQESLDAFKATSDYMRYRLAVPRSARRSQDPVTPVKFQADLVKESWDEQVHQWQSEIRSWCPPIACAMIQ